MLQRINFVLNNEPRSVLTNSERTLLDLIREDFSLTGTKKSCNEGVCGACTVLVDGQPVNSCVYPLKNINGREVTTIEGLGTRGNLHPIQKAFMAAGAVQCGYCTPGMILTAKAILDKNLNPTKEAVRKRISRNLCRCTGYQKIIDGILLAGEYIRNPEAMEESTLENQRRYHVGGKVPQIDSHKKVTGTFDFAIDLNVKNICHAKVLHSQYSHAKILNIDVAEAEALKGVISICTHEDLQENICTQDMQVLASDKVHYWGEPVALVVAFSEKVAQEALARIKIEYMELPSYDTPYEAMAENAVGIQPNRYPANIIHTQNLLKGDVRAGFEEADVIVESEYTTPSNAHAYLEPGTGLGWIDQEGKISVFGPGQAAHTHQTDVARALGLNPNQVRIIEANTGGAFGARLVPVIQVLTALAVYKARCPVRLELNLEEDYNIYPKRHPYNIRMKTGARKDGKLVAQQVEIVSDAGAYALSSPGVLMRSIVHSCGPYDIPNVEVKGMTVLTNNSPHSAMRGFGVPQIAFATEMQVNKLSGLLKMDALELRKINGLKKGSATATGQEIMEDPGYVDTVEVIKKHRDKLVKGKDRGKPPLHTKRGFGFASAQYGIGKSATNYAGVVLEVLADGKIGIRAGASDMGQGLNTVVALMAAEELKMSLENITVISADSAETPDSELTCASRQTFYTGNALLGALQKFKEKLFFAASKELNIAESNLDCSDGWVFDKDNPDRRISLKEIFDKKYALTVEHKYEAELPKIDRETCQGDIYRAFTYGTAAAEIEIDVNTGKIKVLNLATCFQCGKAINRLSLEGQLEGSAVMGIGFALLEKYSTGETRGLRDYKIPKAKDVAELYPYIVEIPQSAAPLGAVGLGEAAIVPIAPAIISAVHDACGIWIEQLPATPEIVLKALGDDVSK